MQLVSRKVLFDVMKHKRRAKFKQFKNSLDEVESSSSAFQEVQSFVKNAYHDSMKTAKNDIKAAMKLFSDTVFFYMHYN